MRILLGAEPEPEPEHALLTGSPDQTERLDEVLDRHTAWLAAERDLRDSPSAATQAAQQARRVATDDSTRPATAASRCAGTTTAFVHGKAFVVEIPRRRVLAGAVEPHVRGPARRTTS